jgi:hypothetical protein
MAASATSRKQKAGVVEKPKAAESPKATAAEKVSTATMAKDETEKAEVKTESVKEEVKAETQEAETKNEEKDESKSGLPFSVGSDGLVTVMSEKRAGKSVIGVTGDVVTFDKDGIAKARVEDALHFQRIPDFTFK